MKGLSRTDFEGMEFKTISFSLKQLKHATNNFNVSNKIGEGGFGPVYKVNNLAQNVVFLVILVCTNRLMCDGCRVL